MLQGLGGLGFQEGCAYRLGFLSPSHMTHMTIRLYSIQYLHTDVYLLSPLSRTSLGMLYQLYHISIVVYIVYSLYIISYYDIIQ